MQIFDYQENFKIDEKQVFDTAKGIAKAARSEKNREEQEAREQQLAEQKEKQQREKTLRNVPRGLRPKMMRVEKPKVEQKKPDVQKHNDDQLAMLKYLGEIIELQEEKK